MIPKLLEEKIKLIYNESFEKFIVKKSIRVNTLKITKKELIERLSEFEITQIPWCEEGFFVENKNITNTIEYFLGYYYIQDSASMIPPLVLEANENDIVLDMTASPGSKTTQMAAMMSNKGLIVANDISMKRLTALRFNLQKCGVANTIVTNLDGRWLHNMKIKFNKILLDAPCSSSGTCVSNPNVFNSWSQGKVNQLSRLQKQLLESASKCLEDDGIIVYSTCSIDPEENEEVIDFAVKNLDLKVEKIKLKNIKTMNGLTNYGKREYDSSVKNAVRINPLDNMTEGFFICKLRKY